MGKLTPCPFCGSEGLSDNISYYHDEKGKITKKFSIRCDACGCATKGFNEKHNAEKAWNSRVSSKDT